MVNRNERREAEARAAVLATADLTGADLKDLGRWEQIASIGYANLQDLRNAPPGFREWVLRQGAMDRAARRYHTRSQGFSTSFRAV